MNMHHGNGQQHGQGQTAWIMDTYVLNMDMQQGHAHADTDMKMLHEHGLALGQGHAEWT
jgi:hypothetical protein